MIGFSLSETAAAIATLNWSGPRGTDLNWADSDGATPLMVAAYNGRSGVVRRLLELGADHTVVGTGWEFEGKTALDLAEEPPKRIPWNESDEEFAAKMQCKEEVAALLRRGGMPP